MQKPCLGVSTACMNQNNTRISFLILKHLDNALDPQEQAELTDWLNSSDAARKLFNSLTDKARIKQELEKMYSYDQESAWERIREAMPDTVPIQRNHPMLLWKRWLSVAAILALVTSGALWLYHQNQAPDANKVQATLPEPSIAAPQLSKATITLQDGREIPLDSTPTGLMAAEANATIRKTADGQIQYHPDTKQSAALVYNILRNPRGSRVVQLTLSDGTRLWLNAASEIRYPVVFSGTTRSVEVSGEAYFEVKKDPTTPFLVQARNVTVEVTGTHFNVDAYSDESLVSITLLEGGVKVAKENATLLLSPGQQAQVGQQIKLLKNVDTEQVVGWKNGQFIFHGSDLPAIMRQLGRWYNVEVQFKDSISEHFYGEITRDKNISNVLDMFSKTGSVHFTTKGNLIEVRK